MHGKDKPPSQLTPDAGNNGAVQAQSRPHTSIQPLLDEIRQKHGESLLAILVYGSWLRGKRDTMLDFYVLVDDYHTLDSAWQGWMCRLLPPNVYQIHHKQDQPGSDTPELRAKYALLTLSRFRKAMRDDFHSYFWARFAQPCEILFARDDATRSALSESFENAAGTFLQRVIPAMDNEFSSADLWTRGLALTYQCELRTESSNRGESIYEFNPSYYDDMTSAFALGNDTLSNTSMENRYINKSTGFSKKLASFTWWLRRVQGKILSLLRLAKAALTFNEPLEYLLWKIERHSGIYIEPSPNQLKYPLIFAWPLLLKLYRRGAFR